MHIGRSADAGVAGDSGIFVFFIPVFFTKVEQKNAENFNFHRKELNCKKLKNPCLSCKKNLIIF